MEVLVGAAFVAAYFLWPEAVGGSAETWWNWAGFLVFLMMLVGMAMLFVYDAKWGRLPERPLTFCVVCAILFLSLRIWWFLSVAQNLGGNWGSLWGWFGGLAGALVVLPGLYYILYKVSRERLVGSGDFLLAVPIALVLGDWWLAFWCLFLSNVLGCLVMVPMMMRGRKLHETTHISFGPFLVLGFLVVFFAQDFLVGLL
jgi:prepilin signal peptidase PulO-like enzyme (type II secretory pathway)